MSRIFSISSGGKFNIQTFFNYYKNPARVFVDQNPPITNFFDANNNLVTKQLSGEYITINGQNLYITNYIDPSGVEHMLFTIPTDIENNGTLWDIHYHFGINKKYNSKRYTRKSYKPIRAIFFHKTIQIPNSGTKDAPKCHFYEGIPLYRISRVKCVSHGTERMEDIFPTNTDDYTYISEIIRRPFYNTPVTGGKTRRLKRNKNSTYKHLFRKFRLRFI